MPIAKIGAKEGIGAKEQQLNLLSLVHDYCDSESQMSKTSCNCSYFSVLFRPLLM